MMKIGAVVEVAPDHTGALPDDLIMEAYRASASVVIALVLDSRVPRAEVDRILDPIVAESRGKVHGVLYLEQDDESIIEHAIDRAEFVIASSDAFRASCAGRGVGSLGWPAARSRFQSLAERRGPAMPFLRGGAELQPVGR